MSASCAARCWREAGGRSPPVRSLDRRSGKKQAHETWPLAPYSLSSQGQEIRNDIGQLLRAELLLVRRHRRFAVDHVLAKVGLDERHQTLAIVDELHGVGVFVESAPGHNSTVASNGTHRVGRQD